VGDGQKKRAALLLGQRKGCQVELLGAIEQDSSLCLYTLHIVPQLLSYVTFASLFGNSFSTLKYCWGKNRKAKKRLLLRIAMSKN